MACKSCEKKKVTNNTPKIVTSPIPKESIIPLIPVYSMTLQDKIDIEIGAILVLYSEFNTGYDYKHLIVKHLVNIFKYNEKYKRDMYNKFINPFMTSNYLNIQMLLEHFYEM